MLFICVVLAFAVADFSMLATQTVLAVWNLAELDTKQSKLITFLLL